MSYTVSITNARKDIYKIAEQVCDVHEEVLVYNASTGKNVVIISEEDWNAIKETLHINSIPGLTESILNARNESLAEGTVYDQSEDW